MPCEFDPTLSSYLDGELDDDARRALERHLESCASCRDALAAFESLRREAAEYEPDEDPFARRRALAAVLASHDTPLWRRRISIPAAVLPALVLLASSSAYLVGRGAGSSQPSQAIAPTATSSDGHPGNAISDFARYDRGGRAVIMVVRTRDDSGRNKEVR